MENNTSIGIAPERLWGFLIEPRSWEKWWPAVTFAKSGDFKPLRERSTFEVSLTLGRLTTTLRGEVTLLAEPRALTWEARLWGVPLRQEWYLSKTGRGTRFTARSRFSGFGGLLLRWLRIQRRWATMQSRQGRSLKRLAERML
ncbi:MAG: SRPBCC family protein [Thermoanaerobaculia bacterium]|nr:SRPBCC family protein [Thermoanaerobaculia bacterium]